MLTDSGSDIGKGLIYITTSITGIYNAIRHYRLYFFSVPYPFSCILYLFCFMSFASRHLCIFSRWQDNYFGRPFVFE